MASHYDQEKKCRVGTMDENQFYAETTVANRAFFKSLIAACEAQGGSLKWGAGGVGLRMLFDGAVVGVCFLAPSFAGKKDRIELSLTALAKQIGERRCQDLKRALSLAAGDHLLGATMVSLVDPGELSKAGQDAVKTAFAALS